MLQALWHSVFQTLLSLNVRQDMINNHNWQQFGTMTTKPLINIKLKDCLKIFHFSTWKINYFKTSDYFWTGLYKANPQSVLSAVHACPVLSGVCASWPLVVSKPACVFCSAHIVNMVQGGNQFWKCGQSGVYDSMTNYSILVSSRSWIYRSAFCEN